MGTLGTSTSTSVPQVAMRVPLTANSSYLSLFADSSPCVASFFMYREYRDGVLSPFLRTAGTFASNLRTLVLFESVLFDSFFKRSYRLVVVKSCINVINLILISWLDIRDSHDIFCFFVSDASCLETCF